VSSFHSSSLVVSANYDQITAEVPTIPARKKLKISMDEGMVAETEMTNKVTRTRKPKGPQVLPIEKYPKRVVSDWKVGAHVSVAGGVENAILNAASIG
jgi:AP endonuclease-1